MSRCTSLVSLISFILMTLVPIEGAFVFDVYRMFQYDKASVPMGSQRTSLNLLATTLHSRMDTLSRYIVVASYDQLNETIFTQLLEKDVEGLLVLLPDEDDPDVLNNSNWINFNHLENKWTKMFLDIPIYFARESLAGGFYKELLDEDLHGVSPVNDDYRLIVSAPEAKPIPFIDVTNFQGWLAGSTSRERSHSIAIVASYDTFAVAPELALGADSSSGILAILEPVSYTHLTLPTKRIV
eukprot:TRINITY_DN5482_c0_g5_i1.p1 TRINITY_DN5482_c0_g5~~TRINITY_DN5482_c0_g5_i1.p1  ORF type:complete len:264 (+),score=56.89 TRINITY_DN5482_c0_g5_i1:73-792(+)